MDVDCVRSTAAAATLRPSRARRRTPPPPGRRARPRSRPWPSASTGTRRARARVPPPLQGRAPCRGCEKMETKSSPPFARQNRTAVAGAALRSDVIVLRQASQGQHERPGSLVRSAPPARPRTRGGQQAAAATFPLQAVNPMVQSPPPLAGQKARLDERLATGGRGLVAGSKQQQQQRSGSGGGGTRTSQAYAAGGARAAAAAAPALQQPQPPRGRRTARRRRAVRIR